MARAFKEVDVATLERLAASGHTQKECAILLGCSEDTIQRNFHDEWAYGLATLKQSLRRKQVELAEKGNVTMLIWLGKNILDQSDKTEVTGKGGAPLLTPTDREAIIERIVNNRDTAPKIQ